MSTCRVTRLKRSCIDCFLELKDCVDNEANHKQIPSNICCKWLGPGWFIPGISLCFGIASIGTAFVHDIHSICGVRFLLGIFEAGMLYDPPTLRSQTVKLSC